MPETRRFNNSREDQMFAQKVLSIPRLELQAAVLGVRLANSIKKNQTRLISSATYWSDSKTVLSWIKADHRTYKPFVSHRLAEIAENSTISSWRWIPTRLNVADDATRLKPTPKFDPDSRWLKGPEFLKLEKAHWPVNDEAEEDLPNHDVELRSKRCFHTSHVSGHLIDFSKFSKYSRLKRTVAWMVRFIQRSRYKERVDGELTVLELRKAEEVLCRLAQRDAYQEDLMLLGEGQTLNKSSSLYKLTPCIDDSGVLRVKGRIDHASYLPELSRRPIIMPKGHAITRLLISDYHNKFHHQNQELIITEIRYKWWVPSLRTVVRTVAKQCQKCKVDNAKPEDPLMGSLPADRVTPFVRPFSYTGLDYFGPVNVSIGRRREKRWVALFTCLTVRAVHLEVATDLSTDSCILCIRNFINRRGVPLKIRSDHGTNFIGAQRELSSTSCIFDQDRIRSELSSKGIEWEFICPANPNAGGCWERLVRCVKRVLGQTLKETSPRQDAFTSLLIEAESIVNSRPLTHLPVETDEEEPLTPNHFLLGCPNSTQTPGPCDDGIMITRKQWRIVQQLKNRFWHRWINEYLPTLVRRTKWFKNVKPLAVGELVLVCDVNARRSEWPRGRIVQTYPGKDGQVRIADIKTASGIIKRPANKLAVLDVGQEQSGESTGRIHGGENVPNSP